MIDGGSIIPSTANIKLLALTKLLVAQDLNWDKLIIIVTNNCETYANWCRHGEEKSDQVRDFVVGASVTAAVVTIAAAGTAAASSRAHKRK
ncbi:hypothetical protein Ddc_16020 [Ditylenchus destructor]|nr:hypothetical protein Ddc_16020 [Ditylenchus destructor]